MIALLCSVPTEAELLAREIQVSETRVSGGKSLAAGMVAGRSVLLCVGGMGKVNAAHAATLLLSRPGVRVLLVFGVGGAYPASGAQVGDLAVATREIAGDEGVLTAEGFRDTQYIGIPLLRSSAANLYNVFPASDSLLKPALRILGSGRSDRVHAGAFVTLSSCTGTASRASELEMRYHGLCENMEGAAAAQVALSHEVPWLEVRGISNLVEDRNLTAWNIPRAAEAVQKAVLDILKGLDC